MGNKNNPKCINCKYRKEYIKNNRNNNILNVVGIIVSVIATVVSLIGIYVSLSDK